MDCYISFFHQAGNLFLPFIVALPKALGMTGVEITQPAADLCNFFCCLPFAVSFLKTLNCEDENEEAGGWNAITMANENAGAEDEKNRYGE